MFRPVPALFLVWALSIPFALSAEKKLTPRHDPPDQLFRRAPMAQSARSIAVPLATNLHLAFDSELNRVHTAWRGGPLNLWGPPYSHAKSPFICDFDGQTLYSFPPISPWWTATEPLRSDFRAINTAAGIVQILYELHAPGSVIPVRESFRGEARAGAWTVLRRVHFPEGTPLGLRLLVFAEADAKIAEDPGAMRIESTNGIFHLKATGTAALSWLISKDRVRYTNEIITEVGTEKGNPRLLQSGIETRVFLDIPPQAGESSIDLLFGSMAELTMPAPTRDTYAAAHVLKGGTSTRRDSGDAFYRIEHFPLPEEAELIVTGMDWTATGDLAICTWLGEVYLVQNPTGPVTRATYKRFARGLNEPLGLAVRGEEIFVVQKGELTRLADRNGDGEADFFECISDDWGFSGNYHSYTFGPLITSQNDFFVFTTGQRGRYDLPYQGWALRVSADGEISPFCDGLRVPHGWGMYGPENDIFITDNQGNWIATCRLNHLKPRKFYGFPSSIPSADRVFAADEVEPPVLWLPRAISPSASGITTIHDERFGPFNGQMLIGDFQNATVLRACLERVEGEWQGAIFPFAKGFLSGVNRLAMGPDGKLYVGGGKRTWSTAAPKDFSLDRVSFTGEIPFEVREVRATPDGFELHFTKELEPDGAADPENYLVKQFTYKYHAEYGAPEIDHGGNLGATETAPVSAVLAEDGKSVRLVIPDLKAGYVTSFQLAILSTEDEELRQDSFWYTLNRQPRLPRQPRI